MIAWNHANRKYSRALSWGSWEGGCKNFKRSPRYRMINVYTHLAHPWSRHSAEGPHKVSPDTRRGFKGEYTRASQKINWHLFGGRGIKTHVYT